MSQCTGRKRVKKKINNNIKTKTETKLCATGFCLIRRSGDFFRNIALEQHCSWLRDSGIEPKDLINNMRYFG